MHNKGRKNLNKYLIQAASADDVMSSHAYGEVARKHKPVPKRRPSSASSNDAAVAGYKDSMVGSISQYRSGPIRVPERAEKNEPQPDSPLGNRSVNGGGATPTKDASLERRHHFIEPPKRGFNRFG